MLLFSCTIALNDGIDRYKINDKVSSIMFMVICLVEVSFFDMILQKFPLDRIHYIFIKLSLYWVICAMLGV